MKTPASERASSAQETRCIPSLYICLVAGTTTLISVGEPQYIRLRALVPQLTDFFPSLVFLATGVAPP